MVNMITPDLDALQAAAEAATPGPWDASRNLDWAFPRTDVITLVGGRQIVRFVDGKPQFWCTTGKAEQEWANAAFIALANPIAILALIDRLRKAEAVREGWKLVPTAATPEWVENLERKHGDPDACEMSSEAIAACINELLAAAPTSADSEGESNADQA